MVTRLEKVQKSLSKWHADAIYITSPIDIFYLTDIQLSKGALIIEEKKAHLIVDGRYFEACKKKFPKELALSIHLEEPATLTKLLKGCDSLAFDDTVETICSFEKLSKQTKTKRGSKISYIPLSKPIVEIRMIKDKAEIEKIAKACELCVQGFDYAVEQLSTGISEEEVAAELEIFWRRKNGHLGFEPIIAFGANSAYPHHRAGKTKLKKNEIVLIDIGVIVDGYHSDMTRVVHFGKVDPKLKEISHIVQEAQAAAFKACKEGVKTEKLDTIARSYIEKAGFGKQFTHGLGHGVGLEIHELPIIKKDPAIENRTLQSGMVLTIEPGIYLPGVGGVRIEDTVVIQKNKAINLIQRPHYPLQIS